MNNGKLINWFKDEYAFLSNFEPCIITYDGITYSSSEAAFQAQKSANKKVRKIFADLNPSQSKLLGRNIIIREDWENIKYRVMFEICSEKFSHEPFKSKLIKTGDAFLMEGTYWHDQTWGVCYCSKCGGNGKNELGQILMKIRDGLQIEQMDLF